MRNELSFLAVLAASYLIGSIPFGVVYAKLFRLGDLRKIGSGNIGATNVLRTGNKGVAALTLLSDMLKGTLAVYVLGRGHPLEIQMFAALGAVLGHIYPVWLRLKGGKGVATYLGVTLAISPVAAFAFAAVWLSVAAVTRYSSLSALVASAITPFLIGYLVDVRVGFVFFLLTGLVFWKHSANLKRLMSGTESRIGSDDGQKQSKSKSRSHSNRRTTD